MEKGNGNAAMKYGKSIVNELLISYENSANFSGSTGNKVFLKRSVKLPDCESPDYEELLSELRTLQSRGLIDFKWEIQDHVAGRIWLVLENVEQAYAFVCRENKHQALERVKAAILKAEQTVCEGWIRSFLDEALTDIECNKLTGVWNKEQQFISDLLSALGLIYTLNGKSITMRLASIRLYADSKRFEKDIMKPVISIAKRYDPVISETDVEKLSEREILSHLGIIKMPEIFEFCGNLKIYLTNGIVDFSPIKSGACISSDCLNEINHIELSNVERVIFIENKTNYSEYCLNSRDENELVIYHGGLYSHCRGKFFELISRAISSEKVYYWGDIDMGGFNMFVRLKNNIFPTLEPFNMDEACFEKYREQGLARSDNYIQRLLKLKEDQQYRDFYDVIDLIAKHGVTVEQEIFIDNWDRVKNDQRPT